MVDKVDENPLNTLNRVYTEVMENRKLANRQLDSAKKILASLPEVTEVKTVSVTELVAKKERLQLINATNKKTRQSALNQDEVVKRAIDIRNEAENEILLLEQELVVKK